MEGEGWKVEEKNEGPTTTKGERRKWIGGREGKRKGFADQRQTASYAPAHTTLGLGPRRYQPMITIADRVLETEISTGLSEFVVWFKLADE